ncbi:MAG: hypothetical protein ACR2G4_08930 [Pyrinomonadaceae bacterium]
MSVRQQLRRACELTARMHTTTFGALVRRASQLLMTGLILAPLAWLMFVQARAQERVVVSNQSQTPIISNELKPTGLINLAHLNYLCEEVEIEGQKMLLTHIYAEAPGYQWTDAAGEGVAALDDVARATIVYLDHYAQTGDRRALERARAGLNFTLYLQTADGEFYNFLLDREGRINRDGKTSRKSLDWWAYRGLWALARGVAVFKNVDADYAARLDAAYLKTEKLIAARLSNVGKWTTVHNFRVPAWLPGGAADATGVLLLALAEYQATRPNAATRKLLITLADGVSAYQLGGANTYPFAMHPHTTDAPGFWHAWGAHEAQGLARAGLVLRRADYIESARREIEILFAWQLATERVHELGVLPRREGQQVYGINCIVQACLNLYHATGDERYARMAGLHASWLLGNNLARVPMYDETTGRGYDGIDGAHKVNRNAGAESTIEALMILQAVLRVPTAAGYLDYKTTSQQGWQVLEAEEGRVAASHPICKSGDWMNEARISGGRYCQLKNGEAIELTFEISETSDYLLYLAHLRRAVAATSRRNELPTNSTRTSARGAFVLRLDRNASLTVREAVSPDRDHLWLDNLTTRPLKLRAGKHTLRLTYVNPDRSASTIVDGFLLHPAIATKTLRSASGVRLRLSFDMRKGALTWHE